MEIHPATLWEAHADTAGDRAAVVQGAVRRTWRELEDRAARLARALAARGVGPGSKVGELLYNSPEYVEGYFAALKMRAVPFNVNYRYTGPEIAYLIENADAEALIFHASLREAVAAAIESAGPLKALFEVDDGTPGPVLTGAEPYEAVLASAEPAARIERSPDDITMIYTGGTTGMPKGVVARVGPALEYLLETLPPLVGHRPQAVDQMPALASELAAEGRTVVGLTACPLMHNTGLAMGMATALAMGGTVSLLPSRRFDAAELWDTAERDGATSITIVGDAFARPMLAELQAGRTRDLSAVQIIASSGAMFATEVKAGLLEVLPQAMALDLISASEGTMGVSIATSASPAVTGQFIPAPGVIVVTPEGEKIEPGSGDKGLIALPGGADSYFKDEAKSAATFKMIGGTRYTLPGDWATVEADGTLRLLGRGSQCINTAGEKVFPEEVEEALKTLPTVEDALVFGLPDERFGQRVAAVLSRPAGVNEDVGDTVDALRGSLAVYKLPRIVTVVETVPRTQVGKADYPAARDLLEADGGTPVGSRS